MAKKKAALYKALAEVTNKAGKTFAVGDMVTSEDFPAGIIKRWLAKSPPVLKEVTNGSHDKR
jgi:glycogen synthase